MENKEKNTSPEIITKHLGFDDLLIKPQGNIILKENLLYQAVLASNTENGLRNLIEMGYLPDKIILSAALEKDHHNCVKFLINNGADATDILEAAVNSAAVKSIPFLPKKDINNNTALHFACQKNKMDLIKELPFNDEPDNNGNSPLLISFINNHQDAIKHLIKQKNINFNIVNKNGESLLFWAINNNMVSFVSLLVLFCNKEIINNSLMFAVKKDSPEICKILVDHEVNINDITFNLSCQNNCAAVLIKSPTITKYIIKIGYHAANIKNKRIIKKHWQDTLKIKEKYKEVEKYLECPICHGILIFPVLTETGHTFCADCIDDWFKKSDVCPISNIKIKKNKIPNIVLENIMDDIYF